MWQRFTEPARRVVFFAQEETGRFGENSVTPEHLLLGLLREKESFAARLLNKTGLSREQIRNEVERQLVSANKNPDADMQLTPIAKRVTDLAYDEARQLKHKHIGTEHLLLGLIREDKSLAGQVLRTLGADIELIRAEIKTAASSSDWVAKEERHNMWQRFTERARRVVFFAQEEAGRLGQNEVGTEHLLMGLVRENDSVAARVLNIMGVSLGLVRSNVEQQVTRGDGRLGHDMQLTPRAKQVIDFAYDEARQLNNNYIGTEHLLLGLIREGEDLAGRVLAKLGVELERTRREVMALQDNTSEISVENRKESLPDTKQTIAVYELRKLIDTDSTGWRRKNLLSLLDVSAEQFRNVLEVAAGMKALDQNRQPGIEWKYPRTLGMIFEKPSLRTRVSFEASMVHLKGHAIYLAPGDVGLGHREPAEDVAGVLSRWVDIITARVFAHETVEELAAHSSSPVINALSDREHPLQAFADLLTLQEHKGELGNKLKLAYVGDGNNVLHALLIACAKLGVNISAACPAGYKPSADYVAAAQEIAKETGTVVEIVTEPMQAVANADAVYTDVWASMGQEAEKQVRAKIFAPYQINAELMELAKPDAIVLHCLPAHREEEVSAEMMAKHKTVILDQAENRLHTQKALLALIVGL